MELIERDIDFYEYRVMAGLKVLQHVVKRILCRKGSPLDNFLEEEARGGKERNEDKGG